MTTAIAVPSEAANLYSGYLDWLEARGVGNRTYYGGARSFLARFPDPQDWAALTLEERHGSTRPHLQPLLNFLMLHGHLRPGYDYLLDRKFHAILRDAPLSPLGRDVARFLAGAEAIGYSVRARTGMASEVVARMLIQTGRRLDQFTDGEFSDFETAITAREARQSRQFAHYRDALYAARAVIYHLGAPAEPAPKRSTLGRWSWERHLEGVRPHIRTPMAAYLERLQATLARATVQTASSDLAHFGRFLSESDPGLESLALLDRRRHIEPYLSAVAATRNRNTGLPIVASTAKERIQSVSRFLEAMAEWGWPEAPQRLLIFPRDSPRPAPPAPLLAT